MCAWENKSHSSYSQFHVFSKGMSSFSVLSSVMVLMVRICGVYDQWTCCQCNSKLEGNAIQRMAAWCREKKESNSQICRVSLVAIQLHLALDLRTPQYTQSTRLSGCHKWGSDSYNYLSTMVNKHLQKVVGQLETNLFTQMSMKHSENQSQVCKRSTYTTAFVRFDQDFRY